jgi:hypothetical protein
VSDTLDLTLVLRNTERAARAAEAALAVVRRLETELGHRMTALEARFSGLEGRIPAIAAGINSHELGLLKVTDMLLDHDGRFDAIDRRLDGIEATLAAILAKLSGPGAAP